MCKKTLFSLILFPLSSPYFHVTKQDVREENVKEKKEIDKLIQ